MHGRKRLARGGKEHEILALLVIEQGLAEAQARVMSGDTARGVGIHLVAQRSNLAMVLTKWVGEPFAKGLINGCKHMRFLKRDVLVKFNGQRGLRVVQRRQHRRVTAQLRRAPKAWL
jgi:hypothetical protein